jgi:hypothetical protein
MHKALDLAMEYAQAWKALRMDVFDFEIARVARVSYVELGKNNCP